MNIKCLLFDLDGTLLDTAPDFTYAINQLLRAKHKTEISCEAIKPAVANGSASMLKFAFGIEENHADFIELRDEFLKIYSENIAIHTKPFDGIREVVSTLSERGIPWGIVTNKPEWLTKPLLAQMQFAHAPDCVISGDTLPRRKPYPDQLLFASQQLKLLPEECLYVGDAEIDVLAANKANMPILVAKYGYLGCSNMIETWEATGFINEPLEILKWLPSLHPVK